MPERKEQYEKIEVKEIGDYDTELFEALYEWDDGLLSWQVELPRLQDNIERVMQLSENTKDEKLRATLALIEQDARKCLECILRRLAVEN